MARIETRLRPTVLLAGRSAALVALLAAVSVGVAEAQIGGLLKKAKNKVEQSVAGTPPEAPVPFDEVMLELTDARLVQVVAGFEAGRRVLEGTNGEPGLAALSSDRDQAIERRSRLYDANSAEIERFRQNTSRIRECRDDAFGAIEREQQDRYAQRVLTDPALQQVMVTLAHEMAEATRVQDTVAMRRINRRMLDAAKVAVSPADSAAVDTRCGRLPRTPAAISTIDSLAEREQQASQAIRRMEQRAADEEVRASGLQQRQLGMARERILLFLSAPTDRPARGFSPTERSNLASRRTELQRYF